MSFVKQKHLTDCGIAALAMLCDVEYEEANRAIPWRREGHRHGTTTRQLREGGIKLGYRTESTPQDRMKPLHFKLWPTIPDNSLVKIRNPNEGELYHWVVWKNRKIYDPACGVYKPLFYNHKPSSYMQFIKEK